MQQPLVSLIIPALNEEEHIGTVLEEVLRQDYPAERLEVFVIDGGSVDGTAEAVRRVQRTQPRVQLLSNPARVVPAGLNLGVRAARGELIIRLDAHASYPPDYVSSLVQWQQRLGADVVGCCVETKVRRPGAVARAIELALSTRVGVGNSEFRVGVMEALEVDALPFGCYRRDVFERVGLFDERLIRNQDIEFYQRVRAAGGRVCLVPGVRCVYYAPATLRRFARKNFENGLWNLLTVAHTRRWGSLGLRHYVPGAFVLSLVAPLAVMPVWGPAGWLTVASAILYLLVLVAALAPRVSRCPRVGLVLAWAVLVMHLTYGAGSLVGLLRAPGILWRAARARRGTVAARARRGESLRQPSAKTGP